MEKVTLNCCGIKFWYRSKFKNKGFDDRRDSPYEETQLISSDNVYFGDPQIITYSAGRDLKISTFSGADLQIGILGSEDPRPRALRSEDRTQQYR